MFKWLAWEKFVVFLKIINDLLSVSMGHIVGEGMQTLIYYK